MTKNVIHVTTHCHKCGTPIPMLQAEVPFEVLEECECVLTRVQREVGEWAQKQFGNNASHDERYQVAGIGYDLHSIPPFFGIIEELGEIAGPICKRHQGRKFTDHDEQHKRIKDGVSDLLIFLCDFARREGINLAEALDETWEVVKRRNQATWEADKNRETGHTTFHDDDERPMVTGDYRAEDERLPITQTSSGNEREDLPDPPVPGGYTGSDEGISAADVSIALARGWHTADINSPKYGKMVFLQPPNGDLSEHWDANWVPVQTTNGVVQCPIWLNNRMRQIEQEEFEGKRPRHPISPSFAVTPATSGAGFVAGPLPREQNGQGWSETKLVAEQEVAPAIPGVRHEIVAAPDGWHIAKQIAEWLDLDGRVNALRTIAHAEAKWRAANGLPARDTSHAPPKGSISNATQIVEGGE